MNVLHPFLRETCLLLVAKSSVKDFTRFAGRCSSWEILFLLPTLFFFFGNSKKEFIKNKHPVRSTEGTKKKRNEKGTKKMQHTQPKKIIHLIA